jgi:uncharacterized protein YqfA (UPF0365 family)
MDIAIASIIVLSLTVQFEYNQISSPLWVLMLCFPLKFDIFGLINLFLQKIKCLFEF